MSTPKTKSLVLFASVGTVLVLSAIMATPWLAATNADATAPNNNNKPPKFEKKKFQFNIDNDSAELKKVKITIDNGFDQVNKAVAVAKNGNAAAVVVAPVSINNAVVIQVCAGDCHQETVVAQDNTNVIEVNIAQGGSVIF